MAAAVDRHDIGALFDGLMYSFSFQECRTRLPQIIWPNTARRPGAQSAPVSRLNQPARNYKPTSDYSTAQKSRGTCADLPTHCDLPAANPSSAKRPSQPDLPTVCYLFIRDVADGDLVGWIDDQLDQANDPASPHDPLADNALIEPLRNVYGVSDKVLAMALSGILIGAGGVRPNWLEVGVRLIAVDTLVHNFLHRTGILNRFEAAHPYGPGCYRPGGCAEIIRLVSKQIDARQFNRTFPQVFPRFVQVAIWRYCSQQGFDICNGNRIDDESHQRKVAAGTKSRFPLGFFIRAASPLSWRERDDRDNYISGSRYRVTVLSVAWVPKKSSQLLL